MIELSCDVLVIGSGPGGATTAALLAEAGRDVLLAEEGAHHRIDSAPAYSLLEMDQKYRAGGLTPALGDPKITYIEGRCVGGASEINAGLYHRPLPETLDGWAERHVLDDFGSAALAPYLDACEEELSVSPRPMGISPASQRLKLGAARLAWSAEEVPKFWRYERASDGSWAGRRQSMSETMVPRFEAAGGRLLPSSPIRHLELDGRRAVAAVGRTPDADGVQQRVRIRFQDVFVCAGAVQTAALLRRSGIKDNVGEALTLNPMIRLAARFEDTVNDPSFGVPVYQIDEFKPDLTLGCSHSSLAHLAMWLGGGVEGRHQKLTDWDRMAIFYAKVCGTSRGTVRSLPYIDEPLVRYQINDHDLASLSDGLVKLGRLLFAAGAIEMYSPVEGQPPLKSEDDLKVFARGLTRKGLTVTAIHLHSSCPMGGNGARAAVDSWGRLHDLDNVRLNDSSILPESPGVNPQGTIMAVARRNTDHFLASSAR